MAQATTADNTDELLSQLAASEIDRLLSEPDGKPATPQVSADDAAQTDEAIAKSTERTALLEAAGFESPAPTDSSDPTAHAAPTGDERSALLKAAGFESTDPIADAPDSEPAKPTGIDAILDSNIELPLPIYLKPLIWINAPMENCPPRIRPLLGGLGVVTLLNALAALTYVYFFRKH